jgi:two-component system, LytTR family, response regulator LytT
MPVNSIIIEDELPNAKRLNQLLQQTNLAITVTDTIQTVKEAVSWFKNNRHPDLIFMDIRLTDGLSFEIFKQVEIMVPVIFTTAYDEYALQAFKVNSIDYLLKPIEKQALERALVKFNNLNAPSNYSFVADLMSKMQAQQTVFRNRFLVGYRDLLVPINTDEIAYFGSEFKNTFFVTHSNIKYTINQTMEEVENELDSSKFFRVTRQYIISAQSIHKIHTYFNGRLKLELKPKVDDEVVISREKSNQFKEWLNK